MASEAVRPLHPYRPTRTLVAVRGVAAPRGKLRFNATLGMGLWALLWAGYNTGPSYLADPGFPHNTMELIHGLRAYVPILAGWLSLVIILTRASRLRPWLRTPVGLILLYGAVGLFSSAVVSVLPADALYWGCMYLSVGLVLMAIVLVDDPLSDLHHVLQFTWAIGILFTFSLLGLMPFMGKSAVAEMDVGSVTVHAYTGAGHIIGMAMTRNTGLARYAAISGIVAIAQIWDGKPVRRAFWAVVLGASVYALVISNGRTEVISFVLSVFAVMFVQKRKRAVSLVLGAGCALLLGITGFYTDFFLYITRTGNVDTSLTGRTNVWTEGWNVFCHSPFWGLGFQADRYYLQGMHMHDAFLHVLVQSGVLGGVAIISALAIVWHLTIKYFYLQPPRNNRLIPPEIPGVLLFVTISSVTESTFAYFSAAWLLSAPIFAYVVALDRRMRKSRAIAAWATAQQALQAERNRQKLVLSNQTATP